MRTLRRTALAGLLALALTTPALTAAAVGEVVSDVQISWADATHQQIRVTWQEESPEFNSVQAYLVSGWPIGVVIEVPADAPNEALVPTTFFGGQGVLGIGVNGVSSALFDTTLPASPVVTSLAASYGEAATLTWRPGDLEPDTTPNDPLDLPQLPSLYRLGWQYPGEVGWAPIGEFSSALSGTGMPSLPERRDYQLTVLTTPNEWGPSSGNDPVSWGRIQTTTTAATWTGARRIEGTVNYIECVVPCMAGPQPVPQAGRRVVLQYRSTPGGAWQRAAVVNSGLSGTYRFGSLATTGQYRVVVPPAAAVRYGYHVAFGGVRTPVVRR
jgi:hypothetical protein